MTDADLSVLEPDATLEPDEQAVALAKVPPPTAECLNAAAQIADTLAAEQDGGIESVLPTVESEPGKGAPSEEVKARFGLS